MNGPARSVESSVPPAPGDAGGDVWLDAGEQPDADTGTIEAETHRLKRRHRSMLAIAALVVLLTFVLQVRPDQRVEFRWGPPVPLPESCVSRSLWGIACPGCGLTRSFVWMARGDWDEAFRVNRVGGLLALAVLGQFPYRIAALAELRRGVVTRRRWPRWFGHLLIAALIGNWLLRQAGI